MAKEGSQGFEQQTRFTQEQLQTEERKLSQTQLQLNVLAEKRRTLESRFEPEPSDVAVLVILLFQSD